VFSGWVLVWRAAKLRALLNASKKSAGAAESPKYSTAIWTYSALWPRKNRQIKKICPIKVINYKLQCLSHKYFLVLSSDWKTNGSENCIFLKLYCTVY
jgi:hypothetical protein